MGFIQKSKTPPKKLSTTRTLTITAFSVNNKIYYFRTRELSDVIGAKQPFEMVRLCRKLYGNNCILSGKQTEAFRTRQDSDRTTFISAQTAIQYLSSLRTGRCTEPEILDRLLQELKLYVPSS